MELLPWLVGWRAVWALLSTSYYVPDETWQSVEVIIPHDIVISNIAFIALPSQVAHKIVFGNGYLTWEWNEGLRSLKAFLWLHPDRIPC